MKSCIFVLTLALLPLLTGCADAERRGALVAGELVAAWDDSAAVAEVKRHYAGHIDQLWWPGAKSSLDRALLDAMPDNDTLQLAARLLTNGTATATECAATTVMALQSATVAPDRVAGQIDMLMHVSQVIDGGESGRLFSRETDRHINELTLDEQMAIYARVTTPYQLGRALADDRDNLVMENFELNRRIECLRGIYSPDEMRQFLNAYQSK